MSEKSEARITVTAGLRRRPVVEEPANQPEIPRLARLLALAHRWDRMLNEGAVASQAEISRRTGLGQARISQIMDLRRLEPRLQVEVVTYPGISELPEGPWRDVASFESWNDQLRRLADGL